MIQESVRELTAEERAELRRALLPQPVPRPQPLIPAESWIGILVAVLTLAAIALFGGSRGGLAVAGAAVALVGGYHLVTTALRNSRERKLRDRNAISQTARRHREATAILEHGLVTVKRVRATAVVELQPMEDEGPGYLFELDPGRVLFLKGVDYQPLEEDAPWPSTDFEIVRAARGGEFIHLYVHGAALPPLRILRGDECDPEEAWEEREVVLQMSLDEAVTRVHA